jgi:GH24 family phage-related lysozyme (muramidase)
MSLDGTGEGDGGWSTPDLLAFVRNLKRGPQVADDPIAQYLAARAHDARLPPSGGLFGQGYAAYMADNAAPMPPSAASGVGSGDPAAWLAQFAAGVGQGGAAADINERSDPGGSAAATAPDPLDGAGDQGASAPSGLQASSSALSDPPPIAPDDVALPSDVSLPAPTPTAVTGRGAAADPDAQLAALKTLLAAPGVEGFRTDVYRDNAKAKNPTVGIGHKVVPADHLKVGDTIDKARIDQFFARDGGGALDAARAQTAEAGITDPNFIVPLASVNFQLGHGWTDKFPNAWRMIKAGDYAGAAAEVAKSSKPGEASDWYKQSKNRVIFFQNALRALPPKPRSGR